MPREEADQEEDLQRFFGESSSSSPKSNNSKSQEDIDRTALRSLIIHRRQAQAKKEGVAVFHSSAFTTVSTAISSAVRADKLSVRTDRDMYADLGLREQLTKLILSYQDEWLRLGLETIFGESVNKNYELYILEKRKEREEADAKKLNSTTISAATAAIAVPHTRPSLKSTTSTPAVMLKKFVVDRVLGDPELLAKYTRGKCKVPSGKFEHIYKEELRKSALTRVLTLIAFLDTAKQTNILDKIPCLFKRLGEVKSSREFLNNICTDFMKGEGNFVKHLENIGMKVSYNQTLIDDYDFAVSDLSVDLRDGVRLCRMTELLTNDTSFSLSKNCRVPAISRLQKIHNVKTAFEGLSKAGVSLGNLNEQDVVDGNRAAVLSLLWRTIVHFKLSQLINIDQLKLEIESVQKFAKRRTIVGVTAPSPPSADLESNPNDLSALLLLWSKSVCSCFGLEIDDFTASFADGRALCLLISYYHPGILKRHEISPTTNSLPPNPTPAAVHTAVMNEQRNVMLAKKRMSELGGIPGMLGDFDSTSIPEEKSVITCVAYLCSRLMESSAEIQATLTIQRAWRKKFGLIWLDQKRDSALLIWNFWLSRKSARIHKTANAVKKIENFVLHAKKRRQSVIDMRKKRNEFVQAAKIISGFARIIFAKAAAAALRAEMEEQMMMNLAATMIQSVWRKCVAQVNFVVAQISVIKAQSVARCFLARNIVRTRLSAVLTLQSFARMTLVQTNICIMNFAAAEIQRVFRGFQAQITSAMRSISVVKLQCFARLCLARKTLATLSRTHDNLLSATITIQSLFRGFLVRTDLMYKSFAATTIQTAWRGFSAASEFQLVKMAATMISNAWRMNQAKKALSLLASDRRERYVAAATVVANAWRSKQARQTLRSLVVNREIQLTAATTLIANVWRAKQAKRVLNSLIKSRHKQHVTAATAIQKLARSAAAKSIRYKLVKQRFALLNFNATKIQSLARIYAARKHLAQLVDARASLCLKSASVIQTKWRSFAVRSSYKIQRVSAVVIQSHWRAFSARTAFENYIVAQMIISRFVRKQRKQKKLTQEAKLVVSQMRTNRNSATTINTFFRSTTARRKFAAMKASATKISSLARSLSAQKKFKRAIFAAITLQSTMRRRIVTNQIKKQSTAATTICSVARMRAAVLQLKALNLRRQMASATTIQCFVRMVAARTVMMTLKKLLHQKLMVEAAVKLQAVVRMFFAKSDFELKVVAAIISQRWWRLMIHRKLQRQVAVAIVHDLRREKMHKCATMLQRVARGRIVRNDLDFKRFAVTEIARVWRGSMENKIYVKKKQMAVVLQAAVRSWISARSFAQLCKCGIVLQSAVRMFLLKCRFSTMKKSVTLIASIARMRAANIVAGKLRDIRDKNAATTIQKHFRGLLAREQIAFQNFAALAIQTQFRRASAQSKYAAVLVSCITIQSTVRGRQAREWLAFSSFAVTKIQSMVRVIMAKKLYRKLLANKHAFEVDKLTKKNCAKIIQRRARRKLEVEKIKRNVSIISRNVRVMLARMHANKIRRVVRFCQTMWRGYNVRRGLGKTEKIASRRCVAATQEAIAHPEMKLGVRTNKALSVLLNSKRLAECMKAITTLETSSRLSEVCCVRFVEAEAPRVLFQLITTVNRSLPHRELLLVTLMTLRNVASRGAPLVNSVCVTSYLDVLLDQLQNFRDKKSVFLLAADLVITIVSSDVGCREYLAGSKEHVKRLTGIAAINKRKVGGTNVLRTRVSANTRPNVSMVAKMERNNSNKTNSNSNDNDKKNDLKAVKILECLFETLGI